MGCFRCGKPILADRAGANVIQKSVFHAHRCISPVVAAKRGWTPFRYFYKYRIMEITATPPTLTTAATAFAALGSEQRLSILRRLVMAGRGGLPMGVLGEDVGIAGSVLTHHLKQLASAGLVEQRRDGRRILCSVDFAAVENLSQYLILECCADEGALKGHHHG